jgi:LemA protein
MKNLGWIIFGGIVVILLLFSVSSYNGLINKEENVNKAWSNVEVVYQKRLDLVDNLIEIVAGEANFEKSTLTGIVEARSNAFNAKIDPSQLTEENIKKFESAQNSLTGALGRIAFIQESYPQLRTNESFQKLQDNLTSIENEIKIERRKFNDDATILNKAVRRFPSNIFAGMMGLSTKPLFASEAGAEKAPKIKKEHFE